MSPQQTVNHPFISILLGSSSTNDFDETMSERDCLHCNIFMPASALTPSSSSEEELLPVMVWIYGGAFRAGTNASPLYGNG
jgi:carboxylesterase type B